MTDDLGQLISCLRNDRWARGLVLDHAQLIRAPLTGLRADGVDFRHSDLSRSALAEAHLVGCDFAGATLERAALDRATIRMCTLTHMHAAQVSAVEAIIEDCDGAGIDLNGADLQGAQLTETKLPQARMRAARLDGAEGYGVSFRGADLVGASLRGARLDDADFRGADLTGADLTGGRFSGTDFRGAILDGCIWTGTDCSGADFDLAATTETAAPTGHHASVRHDDDDSLLGVALTSSITSALTDPRRPAELVALLDSLQEAATTGRLDAGELMSELDPLLEMLEQGPADEPPEAWRAWLTPLVEAASAPVPDRLVRDVPDGMRSPQGQ